MRSVQSKFSPLTVVLLMPQTGHPTKVYVTVTVVVVVVTTAQAAAMSSPQGPPGYKAKFTPPPVHPLIASFHSQSQTSALCVTYQFGQSFLLAAIEAKSDPCSAFIRALHSLNSPPVLVLSVFFKWQTGHPWPCHECVVVNVVVKVGHVAVTEVPQTPLCSNLTE
jgi:hypothetical protein